MNDYRVYHLDKGERIVGAHWIAADDDDEALSFVREEGASFECEVWDGPRYIGKVASNR